MTLLIGWLRLEVGRRWRSLAVLALLVAVATGTVVTAVAGARRGASALDRLLAVTRPATTVVLPNQPGFDWDKIRELPEVAALTTFVVAGFSVDGVPLSDNASAFPPADAEVLRSIERPVVLAGRLPDPGRLDEVVVTPKFPASYHRGVGDRLTLRLTSPAQAATYDPTSGEPPRGPAVPVRIVGVIRSPWFSDHVGDKGGVLATPALFARYRSSFLGDTGQNYINALVRLRGGPAALPAFRADVARVTGRSDIDVWDVEAKFAAPLRQVNRFEAVCLLAFGLAALSAAIVLVGQSVVRYAAAALVELRVLRAVGMTPRQAVTAASAGPFLAALAGATLGVAGAVVASRWMPIGAASLVEATPGFDLDWPVLASGWALALALVVAGAAGAAAIGLAATRDQPSPRRSAVALAAARAGLPVPVVVGARFALEPGRGASAIPVRPALLGAATGVLGVLAAFTFSSGVHDAARHPARFGQTHQVEGFFGMNGQDFGPVRPLLQALARDPDVTAVNDARVAVAESGNTSVTTYTHDPVGRALPAVLLAGRLPATADEVALAPGSARALHVGVGARVRLGGGPNPPTMTVSGIGFLPVGSHNNYSDGAWATPAGFDRMFTGAHFPFKFHVAEIALRPAADPAKVLPRLKRAVAEIPGGQNAFLATPQPLTELRQIRDVQQLPVLLAGFLGLLAIGAVGHALATAVRRRRHEVAVLRALGMTRPQSRWTVVTQATVLAAVGLAFGVPLGVALGRILWRVVADFTPLAYVPPLALLALLLVGPVALLLANILAVWPSRWAAHLRISHVLRAE